MNSSSLQALGVVLEAIRESTGLPDVLHQIARAVTQVLPCDRATIHVRSRRRNAYVPAGDHGTPAHVMPPFENRIFSPGEFPAEAALREGRSVLAVHGACAPELEEILRVAELDSLLVVPLHSRGRNEGALSCGLSRAPSFRPEQVGLLEEIAPHVALLVRNSRSEAAQARAAERRHELATWAAAILAEGDLESMAMQVCIATRAMFQSTRSGLFLLDGDILVPTGSSGPYGDRLHGGAPLHVAPGMEPIFDEVRRTGEVMVVNEFRRSRWAATPLPLPSRPQAVLVVPLVDANGTIGVLSASDLDEPFRFAPSDKEDARLLGAIAAASLRKALVVQDLTRASVAKSEFLANVSHELRTPLNVLLGYSQLLAEQAFGPIAGDQLDTVERIERCARGQLALINDLLDLAGIEQGKLECTRAPVRLADLVPALNDLMEVLLRGRPIAFEVFVPPDATAFTDRVRLRQILVNLLGNAAKFTQRGRIRLTVAQTADTVEISVSDTGEGFESAFAARAVEPFVRGNSTRSGSGLGLAIVARLLLVLDGALSIESQPGEGTHCRVRLPAAP